VSSLLTVLYSKEITGGGQDVLSFPSYPCSSAPLT